MSATAATPVNGSAEPRPMPSSQTPQHGQPGAAIRDSSGPLGYQVADEDTEIVRSRIENGNLSSRSQIQKRVDRLIRGRFELMRENERLGRELADTLSRVQNAEAQLQRSLELIRKYRTILGNRKNGKRSSPCNDNR